MSQKIQELFQQAESYDADHRFMAANDLCTDLLQPNNKLDPQTIEKIIQVFIKQLDDTTADIKGNAIKCLVKAISKIPENLVGQLCTKLISNIANPATPEETKNVDIYTTCLKSLINEVPENFSSIICTTLAKSGLTKRTGKPEIDEELIDLTNHLLKRFASFIYSHTNILDRDVITKDLLKNIIHEKASLRKKASLCLGSVSLILSPQQAVSVGGELVNNMIANKDKKELLYYTIGFNSMLKGAASKLGQSVKKVLPFILEDIPKRVENAADDFDFNTELLDYYLLILDNIIKNCPQEAGSYLRNIIDKLDELLSFDPNGTLAEDDFGPPDGSQEYDAEWDDAYDLGDTSWKVRRTAIQVTDTFILTHPELLKELTQRLFDKLLKRFSEQEQNVKLAVFSIFSNFLRVIAQRPVTEDTFEDLAEKPVLVKIKPEFAEFQGKVVTMISELIKVFNDKKASSAVKVASSELLLLTTINIPEAVIQQHLDAVIKLIEVNYSQSSNTIELRTNMLKVLGAILKVQVVENKPQIERHYPVINKLILSSLEDKSFKLVSEGFKALTVFYRALRPTLSSTTEKFQTYVKPVIGTVNKTLKSTDIDEEIKYAVTINAVALISTFGDILSAKDLTDLLTFLLAKLKSEIKRQQVMRALSRIPSKQLDFPENVELYGVLDKFLEELFTYLRKQDRTLKILTLQVIKMILDIFKNQLPKNIQQEVLKNISALIKDDDLYLSQLSIDLLITIININPKDSKQYEEAINNCITLSKSSLARGPAVDKLTELFTAITASEIINTSNILDRLLANTNKASLIPTALCINAVLSKIKSVINPYLPIFINNLDLKKDPVLQQLSLLSIGEFGRICDLSGDKKLFDSVLALFDVEDEETKQTASVALGGICLGNIKRCLPIVIQLMNDKKDYQYLLLATLKEVITHTSYQVYEILKEQKFINFLFDYSETPNENLRPIVAECIGKLASHNISSHKDLILSNLQSSNLYRKNTIAMAFRYLCTKKTSVDDLAPLIVPFLSLLNEQNLNIRRATLESLNYIAYTLPKVLQYINQSFQVSLADACKFKPELVKEIELGPFKYPVDEGLTVRNLAFSFIDTGLEKILEYCGVAYVIDLIILGLGDPADDVQITSYQCLRKIINIAPLLLLPYIERLVDRFEESVVKFDKSLNTKQEGERVKDCIRAFLRVVLGLNKIEDIHNMPKFKGFYEGKVAKNDKFKDFLEQVVA